MGGGERVRFTFVKNAEVFIHRVQLAVIKHERRSIRVSKSFGKESLHTVMSVTVPMLLSTYVSVTVRKQSGQGGFRVGVSTLG